MTGPGDEPDDPLERLLNAWLAARRARDQLETGSPAWDAADARVRSAHAVYRARLTEIEPRDRRDDEAGDR